MLISHTHSFTFARRPAALVVIRNNGYCWAQVALADGRAFTTFTERDQYDNCDVDAAEAFERAFRRGKREPIDGSQFVEVPEEDDAA
jgi:hypothetical protein